MDPARARQLLRERFARRRSFEQAVQAGKASEPCDPRKILFTELKLRRLPSRAWLVQWMTQQAIERVLKRPGPALLLLRVTSFIGGRKGVAWISARTLLALSGRNEKTFARDRRALTAPWSVGTDVYPPLFRIKLLGPGLKRIHWIPLEAGWRPFIAVLDAASRAVKDEARATQLPPPEATSRD